MSMKFTSGNLPKIEDVRKRGGWVERLVILCIYLCWLKRIKVSIFYSYKTNLIQEEKC